METRILGMQRTQQMVTSPAQWQLLLCLATGPATGSQLRLLGPRRDLWRLWQHHLVMFHVKQWRWQLTADGESLRPVLQAIQSCITDERQ
ncbi:hypothetical protein [Levilactobacillus huananensis]|uniref:hypothetical protein n=1 Tax=Levilactobacillus huananensis TaxID=2486019 RepID=UPI000F78EF63|nr:hypothetical protein [Levilactobacillus huananensis]